MSDTETIALKFKRSLKGFGQKVIVAAKWLIENSDLFRNEGIEIDSNWQYCTSVAEKEDGTAAEGDQFDNNSKEKNSSIPTRKDDGTDLETERQSNKCRAENSLLDGIDSWSEEANQAGNMDTVMQCLDFREFHDVLSVALVENNSPFGIFQDKNAEYLSFPTIYCGQGKPENTEKVIPLHYSTICKWELRNVDRRSATCIPNLFFKMKKKNCRLNKFKRR